MKRDTYIVCLSPEGPKRWKLTRNKERCGDFDTQAEAITQARLLSKNRKSLLGINAELKIMGKDGQIRDSRTYGDDPRETKG